MVKNMRDRLDCDSRKLNNLKRFCFTSRTFNEIKKAFMANSKDPSEKEDFDLEKINEYVNWDDVSMDWTIEYRPPLGTKFQTIRLNPKETISESNPLYAHRKWLEHLYTNLELSGRKIAEIYGSSHNTINKWILKHKIPKRIDTGRWLDKRSGYFRMYMPKDYKHPELKPLERGDGRFIRSEHVVVMEKYLSENPELLNSKKYLIDGKYLRIGCIIHHINFNTQDNRIENLWIYENNSEHQTVRISLFNCYSILIKLGQILFEKGRYYIDEEFDCRALSLSEIQETLESKKGYIQFKDIKEVKGAIKQFNWFELSNDWTVKYRQNQFMDYIDIPLDPYQDCSDNNPLYRHKTWMKTVVNDERFNLTDSRLGMLCGITREKTRGWRRRLDVSRGRDWGFGRFINQKGRVFMKVPDDYGNPTAQRNNGSMLEHRYVVERYLAENIEKKHLEKYLIDGRYLRPEIEIHHINFDPSDNRLKNLWICKSNSEHKTIEFTLYKLTDKLVKSGFIHFRDSKYFSFLDL